MKSSWMFALEKQEDLRFPAVPLPQGAVGNEVTRPFYFPQTSQIAVLHHDPAAKNNLSRAQGPGRPLTSGFLQMRNPQVPSPQQLAETPS